MEDREALVVTAGRSYEAIEEDRVRDASHNPVRSEVDEDSVDPRDIHAMDRTYGAALRTVFQMLVLSVAIGRQFTVTTTVVSAFFIAYASAMLILSGIRHPLNMRSVKRGIVRVDGITPLLFFALGVGATAGALVYTIRRLIVAAENGRVGPRYSLWFN